MTDYYPYGMDMPGRSFQSEAYRYGYQGSERDPEMSGGAGYTTFFRALDPRIGRWLTPDPKVFPWQSSYVSMDANPVALVDPWGDKSVDQKTANSGGAEKGDTYKDNNGRVFQNRGEGLGWQEITPPAATANTPSTKAFLYRSFDYSRYNSESQRYGFSGSFEQYKAAYGYEGSYSEVEQQYRDEYGYEFEEEWVPKWDEEEQNRRLLEKLSFFTAPFYAIEDVAYVYPGTSFVSGSVNGVRRSLYFNLRISTPKGSVSALRQVGTALESVDDVMLNPSLISGKSYAQVRGMLNNSEGWVNSAMTKTRGADKGWVYRQVNANGQPTGKLIQYHPGSVRHFGGKPYWKVSNGTSTFRFPAGYK